MRNPKILILDRSEGLGEQLERVVDDLRPRPEVHTVTRVGAVGDLLDGEGPFDVLIAGPSLATRSGLARLEVIHDELPDMPIALLLAIQVVNPGYAAPLFHGWGVMVLGLTALSVAVGVSLILKMVKIEV